MDSLTPHGLVTLPSAHSVVETAARLETLLAEKGVRLFARIDHAEGAREAGLPLRPTLLLVFGDPRAGTLLMQSRQTAGIDLPLKALAWEDEAGRCWLSYNRAEYVAERHGIGDRAEIVAKIDAGFAALVERRRGPVIGPAPWGGLETALRRTGEVLLGSAAALQVT